MRVQRFRAQVADGPRASGIIAIPFDPDQVWGAQAEHPVRGQVNGRWVRGRVTPGGGGWVFTVTPMWLRDAYLRYIDATTRRPDLRAARIAEVVDLLAAGIKQRPRPPASR